MNKIFQEEGSYVCGALGLEWNVKEDVLKFRIEVPEKKFTPRGVLSINHCVYDPLNWSTPLIFKGRVLQRKMFDARKKKPKGIAVQWDEPLPPQFLLEWNDFLASLQLLDQIKIPRPYCSICFVPVESRELHVFSDASFDGIGYAIYVRSIGCGFADSSLAMAGSRVAPRSAVSIQVGALCKFGSKPCHSTSSRSSGHQS